ncbi:MFS transporter [Chitinimonas arctica]|uniref:MFS transporter n=1 Tax=Chitinimonas arctica TaxID=2594795 RepID=A0A516SDN7_9NEIS|nr:MFS transporter [Chitinimonas arctica]QDQ26148.1 MFS transporter [Chitinimonas arctica]
MTTALPSPLTAPPAADATSTEPLRAGTAAYRSATLALFFSGLSAFAMLYGPQPLMPVFSADFNLSPAAASGVISAATGALALGLIPAGIVAQRFGPKPTMLWSLVLSALLTLLAAVAPNYGTVLVLRALLGLALAGLPAVAMAYLSQEVEAGSLGRAMGLLIAGNAVGGLFGRLVAATVTDWSSWRMALAALGIVGVLAALCFQRCLPPSRHFHPSRFDARTMLSDLQAHCRDKGLPWLFLLGFLLMGCFVSLYNYLGYRLAAAPFHLSQGQIGLVFSLYLVGMFGSTWGGKLADRFGRRHVLWILVAAMATGLLLTLAPSLPVIIVGIALFTFGFFSAHSVASSWVGRRASHAITLASSLYLCAYYLGSSLLGSASGLMWHVDGWHGVVALLASILLIAVVLALSLRKLLPRVAVV